VVVVEEGAEGRKGRDIGRAREIIAITADEAAGAEEVGTANATTREIEVIINREKRPRKEKRTGGERKKKEELWKRNARWRRLIEIRGRVSRII
jgi:hypothetical protein